MTNRVAYPISQYVAELANGGGGGGDVEAERAERIAADEQLQANIDAETAAREAADQALADRLAQTLIFKEATIIFDENDALHVPSLAESEETMPAFLNVVVDKSEGVRPLCILSAQFWSDQEFMQNEESVLVMHNGVDEQDSVYDLHGFFRGTRNSFDARAVKVAYLAEALQ